MAAVVAGIVLVVAIGAWRLSQPEPLRLSFLTPYVEQALTLPERSIKVAIDDTLITWAGWGRTVDLRVRGVHIRTNGGRELAALPELSLTLSVQALLHGIIAPTSIEVLNPQVTLLRDHNGRFRFGRALALTSDDTSDNAEPAPNGGTPLIPEALAEFMTAPDYGKPSGYLRRISIVDAKMVLVDRRTGLVWHAPAADFSFERHPGGLSGHLQLQVRELGRPAQFTGDLTYDAGSQQLSIQASFSGVDAASLGLLRSELMVLQGADLTLDGRVGTQLNLDGQLERVDFDMSGGPGSLTLPDELEDPMPIRKLAVTGKLDAGLDRLVIDHAQLDLGDTPTDGEAVKPGPSLSLQGQISGLTTYGEPRTGALHLAADIKGKDILVDELARYWPQTMAFKPRKWILANLGAGRIDDLSATLRLRLPGGDLGALALDKVAGTMTGKGFTIHYLKPMPPITDAAATGSFDADSFSASFTAGHVGGIEIQSGRIDITDFAKPVQTIKVDGTVQASMTDALSLLDHPRLGYMKRLGIDPKASAGQTNTHLSVTFPADKDLVFEQVDLSAESSLVGAGIKHVMFGKDLDDANLELTLTRKAMAIEGTGRFAGVASAIAWKQNFVAADFDTRIALQGTVDEDQRKALGVDLSPIVTGPAAFDVTYTIFDDHSGEVAAKFDLGPTTLSIGSMAWTKPAGTAGQAEATVSLPVGQPPVIKSFSVNALDLVASGHGSLTDSFGVGQMALDRLSLGKTNLTGVKLAYVGGRPEVTVAGGVLDVEPLLTSKITLKPEEMDKPQQPTASRPFLIRADKLDVVTLAPGRQVENVHVLLDSEGEYWHQIEIDGILPGGTPLTMTYLPVEGGRHHLSIKSNDAGAALRVLDIFDDVQGGRLDVFGDATDSEPNRPLTGKAEIQDFRLINQSGLVRLISLTGFIDAMTGEGFQFDRFTTEFTKTRGRVDIPLARAHGPSLGATATGNFDVDQNTIDLKGTIVPAYAINSILGNIPLIGDLIQGGEGKGLFAATYTATGKLSEPTFTVNPLAALAPGFLRGLFDIFDSNGQPTPPTAMPLPLGQQNR
ncbi:MAG TPA: AsmA-like C-terminal domain-containing protein [Hypericibacter adhaerens]|uniref:YhdP central domain-containing protein n=1 Tax=Hypericibacter adhaerens TaxID=2602016 RepID=A0A5J6MV51_9PROT|nr:AsmA-like C-terminal domain-containing protein [Hypericibacter adhaerens]QEX21522.1 hypothetical protein FRZ61_14510 [Hypericibacter adhaerens]HWA45571.1 AsmA-like C-terminal domain-containing protein [Hypericibacter adhaerens]